MNKSPQWSRHMRYLLPLVLVVVLIVVYALSQLHEQRPGVEADRQSAAKVPDVASTKELFEVVRAEFSQVAMDNQGIPDLSDFRLYEVSSDKNTAAKIKIPSFLNPDVVGARAYRGELDSKGQPQGNGLLTLLIQNLEDKYLLSIYSHWEHGVPSGPTRMIGLKRTDPKDRWYFYYEGSFVPRSEIDREKLVVADDQSAAFFRGRYYMLQDAGEVSQEIQLIDGTMQLYETGIRQLFYPAMLSGFSGSEHLDPLQRSFYTAEYKGNYERGKVGYTNLRAYVRSGKEKFHLQTLNYSIGNFDRHDGQPDDFQIYTWDEFLNLPEGSYQLEHVVGEERTTSEVKALPANIEDPATQIAAILKEWRLPNLKVRD